MNKHRQIKTIMDEFNPYITNVDIDYWRELCVREGELRHYETGFFSWKRAEQAVISVLSKKVLLNISLSIRKATNI